MVEILGYYHIECQILISFVDFGEREDRKTLWFSAVLCSYKVYLLGEEC